MKRGAGTLLLAIWLILYGLSQFVPFNFPGKSVIMALLALIAGILLLVGK
jgi:hypothetical protein